MRPFEITRPEWDDLAKALQALPQRKRCRLVEPPEWVKTLDDWHTWVMIFNYGYPEEFRHLAQESTELQRAHHQAIKARNVELAEDLRARALEADARLAEFVMAHHRKQQPKKNKKRK